jgi:hypothetical protein
MLSVSEPSNPRREGLSDFPTLSVAYSLNPRHARHHGDPGVTAG